MPELPEVEVTRQGIAKHWLGQTIQTVQVGKALRWPLGVAPQALHGQTVRNLQRRGKYIIAELDQASLIVHLGMSGSLRWSALHEPRLAHDHFVWNMSEQSLRLQDPRRFGAVVWSDSPYTHPLLANLGPEPLSAEFNAAALKQALQHKSQAIKPAIMEQKVVVGVGNIYASEALFMARIHPECSANSLSLAACKRLVAAIQQVLANAILAGGSSLRDYVQPEGEFGCFQLRTQVYERFGEPCLVCGKAIKQIRQAQRSTYFCSTCQK